MNILSDIIDWVESKPKFWQIGVDRLIRNNELTKLDVSELKEISKFESGLSRITFLPVDLNSLRTFVTQTSSSSNIVLSKIHNIDNINALSNTSSLEFASSGLTVVYGDNGAGKSSYVSILKHVCNTRGQKPLISDNIYTTNSIGKDKKAEVTFSSDNLNFSSVSLINTTISTSALKGVDVFDSYSANHYIDGEDEIAFIPQGLALIEKFAIALKQIESELLSEVQILDTSKFDITSLRVDEITSSGKFLQGINFSTTLNQLRAQSEWNAIKAARVLELNAIIPKLRSADPAKAIKDNIEKIQRFKILRNKFEVLENNLAPQELLNNVTRVLNNYITTFDTLRVSSETIFSGLPISGVGSNSWRLLWESARKFYNESKGNEIFPQTTENSNCPLCLQTLDPQAKKRFIDFEEFVKHDIQQEHNKAIKDQENLIVNLNNLSFDFDEQEPTITELIGLVEDYQIGHTAYLETLALQKRVLVNYLEDKKPIETLFPPKFVINSKNVIDNLIVKLQEDNERLQTQSIEDELKPLENELLELNSQKIIYDFKPKLAREIYRQKRMKLLNRCFSQCNTRTVTTLSNLLASTYITQSLQDKFQEELRKLGFKNIKIQTGTRGVKGKQYHFLKLDEPNSQAVALKDILSEGEHRCIALSTFLSELSLSDHNSSIIFDDPVSSLDHKWRNKIAKRIVEESKVRQVIVFTHDITFLLMLQEHCENQGNNLEIKSLTRKKQETGIIASNPPWDALPIGKRIGILKNDYQRIEKIERTSTEEVYKNSVQPLYGKLRETWERFVEEVLLNGIIQRFGREIQTQRLSKLTDLTEDDYNKVDLNMSKCSKCFLGHDTAGALIEEMPDSSEFLSDIVLLEDFAKDIRARRK